MKKPTIKEQADKVTARYGKTLGASKGSKPTPKISIRVRPRVNKEGVHGFRAKVTKKF